MMGYRTWLGPNSQDVESWVVFIGDTLVFVWMSKVGGLQGLKFILSFFVCRALNLSRVV